MKIKKFPQLGILIILICFSKAIPACTIPDDYEYFPDPVLQEIVANRDGSFIAYKIAPQESEFVVTQMNGQVQQSRAYDQVSELTLSPDEKQLAYIGRRNNQDFLVLDSKEIASYLHIKKITFNQRGELAYFATTQNNSGQYFLVYANKTYLEPALDESPILFSPDGSKVIFIASDGTNVAIVENTQKGKNYYRIKALQFHPTTQELIYVGTTSPDENYQTKDVLVIGGKETQSYREISEVTISSDAKVFAYDAVLDYNTTEKVIINHNPGKSYKKIFDLSLTPSNQVSYIGVTENADKKLSYAWILDDKVLFTADETTMHVSPYSSPFYFNPDFSSMAYLDKTYEKEKIFVDGALKDTATAIDRVFWNVDGKQLAYRMKKNNRYYYAINNKLSEAFDFVSGFNWSSDGKSYAFWGCRNHQAYLVQDGKILGPFDTVYGLKFLANGQLLYVIENNQKAELFIDDKKLQRETMIGESGIHEKNIRKDSVQTFGPLQSFILNSNDTYYLQLAGKTIFRYGDTTGGGPQIEFYTRYFDKYDSLAVLSLHHGDGCPALYRIIRFDSENNYDISELIGNCNDPEIRLGPKRLTLYFPERDYLSRIPAETWIYENRQLTGITASTQSRNAGKHLKVY